MRSTSTRLAAALVVAAVALPAVAWATVSGQQNLQIKVSESPSKAGKPVTSFHLHVSYTNPKSNGQPPYNTHKLIFTEAPGVALNSSSVPQCKESAVVAAKGNATVCPAKSKVGTGTVVVNARPTIPKLITGAVTIYNGVDDKGYAGFPKGSGELILYVQTSIGVKLSEYFHIVKSGQRTKLIGISAKPKAPGVTPGSYSIQKLDMTLSGFASKDYLVNPPSCHKSWPFSLEIENYFNQPSVTAHSKIKCSS